MENEREHHEPLENEEEIKVPWYIDDGDEWARQKRRFTINDLLNEPDNQQFWLWDDYLPYSGISGLTGPADVGKSSILRQLAIEVIRRSKEFLGTKLNVRSGRVVYISTEDGKQATCAVLQKLMKAYNLTDEQRNNLLFIFDTEDIAEEINGLLLDPHVDLIIVDCWGDLFTGNPNDQSSVRDHLKPLKALAERYECCVLLLTHNVKNSEKSAPDKNKVAGSQAIGGKMRSLLELRLGEFTDERLLTIVKGNYVSMDKKNSSLVLKFNPDSLLFTADNRKVPLGSVVGDRGGKFDRELWLQRFNDLKEDVGIAKKIVLLKEKYPDEEIPKKTWFVDNRVKDEAVGRLDDIPENGDRLKDHPFWQ